jgi:hypothetical protein
VPAPALSINHDERARFGFAPRGQLERVRRVLGLPLLDLWLRYAALGGTATLVEVEAILQGEPVPGDRERARLAAALDERGAEPRWLRPVPGGAPDQSGTGPRP